MGLAGARWRCPPTTSQRCQRRPGGSKRQTGALLLLQCGWRRDADVRAVALGSWVTSAGRINGNLNLSRAIGDLKYKQNKALPAAGQIISGEPDVRRAAVDV